MSAAPFDIRPTSCGAIVHADSRGLARSCKGSRRVRQLGQFARASRALPALDRESAKTPAALAARTAYAYSRGARSRGRARRRLLRAKDTDRQRRWALKSAPATESTQQRQA